MKTIFMGTPEYVMPSLEALYEETEVIALFTGPDRRGGRKNLSIIPKPKEFAETHHIRIFQPTHFNDEVMGGIESLKPDLLVVNAYGFILPQKVLDTPKLAAINLHGSLLPKYRGASPIQSSLIHGDQVTGITAQIMAEKMDAGDIIHQVTTQIDEDDDYNTLSYRLSLLSASCLRDVIAFYKDNQVIRKAQNHSDASYCKKIKKEEGLIDWTDSYETLSHKIKAYIHWPQSYTYYKNKKIIIHKVQKADDTMGSSPGSIKQFSKQGIIIQCGDGSIRILSLQLENKKVMDYKAFLNGHHWNIKDSLSRNPME